MKSGFTQLSQTVLSHTTSIKILEAQLSALSTQIHNPIGGKDQICMAITTGSSNPCASSMGSNIPLFGENKECGRTNKGEVNEINDTLDNLENVCDIEDGDGLIGTEIKMTEKVVTPQKLYLCAATFTQP